jgi:hypothetical protein
MRQPLEIWGTSDGKYRWEIFGWVEWPGRDDKQADCTLTIRGMGVLRGPVWYSEIIEHAQRIDLPKPGEE